jgi:hypothetical protein
MLDLESLLKVPREFLHDAKKPLALKSADDADQKHSNSLNHEEHEKHEKHEEKPGN